MDKNQIINKTKEYAKNKLYGEGTGHDWWHILRVYNISMYIGKKENADMFVVELTSLLHDIADWRFNEGSSAVGLNISRDWLRILSKKP